MYIYLGTPIAITTLTPVPALAAVAYPLPPPIRPFSFFVSFSLLQAGSPFFFFFLHWTVFSVNELQVERLIVLLLIYFVHTHTQSNDIEDSMTIWFPPLPLLSLFWEKFF